MKKSHEYEGGGFLLLDEEPADCFVPENFEEDAKEMARAAFAFYEKYVSPSIDAFQKGEVSLNATNLELAGEYGFLGAQIPEKYGGMGLSGSIGLLLTEALCSDSSFAATYGAHVGIGMSPIYYYGSEALRAKYLPKLVAGTHKASYCLTEPQAGSDAASGSTKATPKGDKYLLNGQKIWITNAGFADVFIVFAKIEEDKHLSAFVVEKNYGGIALQEEEKKLGLKGSSTRQVFFSDCPVPKENILAKRGEGFKIAVNVLNSGRMRLSAMCLRGAKHTFSLAINYATERKQFGRTLATFGGIQQKLAQMAYRIYACEAATYRTAAAVDEAVSRRQAEKADHEEAALRSMENYAIECAILKVSGSEMLDYVVDEALQIHGGMGYSEDMPMAGIYRDARITRIFEGTNEINRMLTLGMLLRRAEKGILPLAERATAVGKALLQLPPPPEGCQGPLQVERQQCKRLKDLFLLVAGRTAQLFGKDINEQQEVLMYLADVVIELYLAESALLRSAHLQEKGHATAAPAAVAAKCFLYEATLNIQTAVNHVISALPIEQEEQKVLLMGAKRLGKQGVLNSIALKRELATTLIAAKGYVFTYY